MLVLTIDMPNVQVGAEISTSDTPNGNTSYLIKSAISTAPTQTKGVEKVFTTEGSRLVFT